MKPPYCLLLIAYTGHLFGTEHWFYALAVSGTPVEEITRIIDRGRDIEKQGLTSLIDEALQGQNLTVISGPIPRALYCVTDWGGSFFPRSPLVVGPYPKVELTIGMKPICVFEKGTGDMILVESA